MTRSKYSFLVKNLSINQRGVFFSAIHYKVRTNGQIVNRAATQRYRNWDKVMSQLMIMYGGGG